MPTRHKPIKGFPGYRVCWNSRHAWIESCLIPSRKIGRRGGFGWNASGEWRRLKGDTSRRGYVRVLVRGSRRCVHRLVLESACGPAKPGTQCRHLDGNPANNHPSNLRWGTASENWEDKRRHGRDTTGERNGFSKLDAHSVSEIRQRINAGHIQRRVAFDFGVSPSLVSQIKHRNIWMATT